MSDSDRVCGYHLFTKRSTVALEAAIGIATSLAIRIRFCLPDWMLDMTQSQKIALPSGLPKQFSDGRPGFQRLHKFLKIPNTKAVEAVLAAVKDAVQQVPVAKLQGADRRRVLLLAFYENPEPRRHLWRQMLNDRPPTASRGQPVPSLEFIALQRYDAEFREREVNAAVVQDALRDFPDVVESVADAPDWQRPALAAWPALQRDIADWNALPEDRRDATALALFAVATVLDDHRFLQWAARGIDSLREGFSPLFNDQPVDATPDDGQDVIRQWKESCDAIAVAARTLGADPLRSELLIEGLSDLARKVHNLTKLGGPLTELRNRAVPEKLLQRVDDIVEELAEGDDSPITGWTHKIAALWRSVYPLGAHLDIESLRTDVERVEADLEDALARWRAALRKRTELDGRHQEARRCVEQEDDALKRLDAQDQEAELQQQLGRAAQEIQRAHRHVFQVVAPADQVFDPRRDHHADNAPATPESPDPHEPTPEPRAATPSTIEKAAAEEALDADEPTPTTTQPAPEADEPTLPAARPGRDPVEPAPPATQPTPNAVVTGEDDTARSAEPPLAPEPPTAPEQPAGCLDPPSLDDRQQTSAIEGLWRALAASRPGIAYHIARLCAEHGYANVPPPLADIIAASMLAPAVHSPDSEQVRDLRPILERIDLAALVSDERPQPERDAVSLLLFSATLRPALFAPTTGAPSLLRAVSLSDTLKPVYDLATRVADHADRLLGVRLHASMLRSSETGTWQDQFDALAGRVRAWQARAGSKHNIFGPATRVWRDLIGDDGVLATLMKLISDSDKSVHPDVVAIHEEISDKRTFNELVHSTDQRGTKRNPIVGRALKQMWNDVQPVVHLSGQWLSLMDIRPDTAGFVNQRIDALHSDLKRVGRKAIETLDGAANSAAGGGALAATSTYARNAINELLQSFDRDAALTESSLDANVLRSRDLLYVKDVDIDAGFDPVSIEESQLLDRLLNTAAHADTMRSAFHDRLERSDFIGARLALDLVETEDGIDGDECTASFVHRINDRRKTLRTELRSTQKRLESAFCRGQLPVDDRDATAAALATLRQAAEPSSVEPPRIEEVEVLTESSRRLNEINHAIEASSRSSIEKVRSRLQHVPADRMDEAARGIVDRTIKQGYVQTAHEQINRLECGESVEPPPPVDDPFSKFTSVVDAIETARKTTDPQTIIRCASARERVAAVPFEELAEEDAQSGASLLEAWYQTARKRSVDRTGLQDLLTGLGFSVRNVSPQRSGSQAIVTTEPIADRAVCPSRQFGSEANGRYRVLLNTDRSAMDSIFRSIGIEIRDPTIVLHFGCLGAERDAIRKRATREHRLFLVVDESLVLFLAGGAPNRLAALFRCTLPYSAAQPYATTSGLVPQELFYGRRRERETIMDLSGACFIYGGRQLGKTALLRQVEEDFGRDDRVAKWIDLKVNEIDRAPDLWRVIQRALRAPRVVRGDGEIDPENPKRVERLLSQIREWLAGRDTRRLLLLLDEADHFLFVDAANDFSVSARLKGLMDETNRRFKVVFAGLHNVLRTTRHANHPLAHLGDPICVGAMTSNGEWKAAQDLAREPLQAVGCRFGREDLSTRILAHTNYYPSLIQLYGAELTRRLRDSERAFPYAIDDDAIDKAYGSRELRDAIRERFLLTLQLDQRYEVIAYALAHELKEGGDLDRGLTRDRILEAVQFWWSDGFRLRNEQFDMLLQEMEGLGVLRAIEPDRYTLRNPNILLLLGNREDFEKALTRERTPERPYAPASFRARYPNDPHSARRGPLTRQQESALHRGGVGVICGCPAAGLEDVQEFLSLRIGSDEFSRIQPAADASGFERQLRKLRSVRNSVKVRLVPSTVQWNDAWIRTAKDVLKGKAQGRRLWNRVAFIATPDQLWRLLTDTAAADLDGVDWFSLGPCDLTFLRRWLVDINATADGSEAENFRRISGGWPVELDRFSKNRTRKSWQTRIEELQREGEKNPAKRLRDEFGLTDEAETVLRSLAGADDPFDCDSVELVSSEIGVDPQLVRRRVDWGERLGLLSAAGDGLWTFNPLVRRLLEAVPTR